MIFFQELDHVDNLPNMVLPFNRILKFKSKFGYSVTKKVVMSTMEAMLEKLTANQADEKAVILERILNGLSDTQKEIITAVMARKNIFITGSAGCGKTHVINRIKDLTNTNAMPRILRLSASTAQAANNIGGTTFHSFAGCGLGGYPPAILVKWMSEKKKRDILNTDVLIIDEISMMEPEYFETAFEVIRLVRRNGIWPLGGIQLILVGDFAQIPPIVKTSTVPARATYRKATEAINKTQKVAKYLFQTPMWSKLGLLEFNLTVNYRQKEDPIFLGMLNNIRIGIKLTNDELVMLKKRELGIRKEDLFKYTKIEDVDNQISTFTNLLTTAKSKLEAVEIEKKIVTLNKVKTTWNYTCIFPYKADVECLNKQRVMGLLGKLMQFPMLKSHNEKNQVQIDRYIKNMPVPEIVTVKNGALVKICMNICPKLGLYNGAIATIKRFGKKTGDTFGKLEEDAKTPSAIYITLNDKKYGNEEIEITRQRWVVEDNKGEVIGRLYQFPLTLIYATTLHQIQGATLPNVIIGDTNFFGPGMGYVALSRATSIEGLNFLSTVNTDKIYADEDVLLHMKSHNMPI